MRRFDHDLVLAIGIYPMTDEAQGTARPASVEDIKLLLRATRTGLDRLILERTLNASKNPAK